MELRHLRYYVAVAEDLSFRKAAERLNVAQPALSSQIRDLEDEIGVRLLDRDTRGVRLTEAGAIFLSESRKTLAQAKHAVDAVREMQQSQRGRLALGYSGQMLMGFMPQCLKVFHDKYPNVDVTLVDMGVNEQIAGISENRIHIGFTLVAPGARSIPAHFEQMLVIRSPIAGVLARSHPLARLRQLSLSDMAKENLLSVVYKKNALIHGNVMRRIFAARKLKVGEIKSIQGGDAFRATLESGIGVSLAPEIGSLDRSRYLVFKPLSETGPDLFVELRAVWRSNNSSGLVERFLEVLRSINIESALR